MNTNRDNQDRWKTRRERYGDKGHSPSAYGAAVSNSEDVEIRCKTCGHRIASATATIRADDSRGGRRIINQATWILGRLQCEACAARENKQ